MLHCVFTQHGNDFTHDLLEEIYRDFTCKGQESMNKNGFSLNLANNIALFAIRNIAQVIVETSFSNKNLQKKFKSLSCGFDNQARIFYDQKDCICV